LEAHFDARLAVAGEFLSDAAIDWRYNDDGSIYVTSLDFNFWIETLPEGQGYQFLTYWPFCDRAKEREALSFVNECNQTLPMVQFSLEPSQMRLYGHYALYLPSEIDRRTFVMTARRFAAIFASVIESDGAYMLAYEIEQKPARTLIGLSATTHLWRGQFTREFASNSPILLASQWAQKT
jgi:hypothetical protein